MGQAVEPPKPVFTLDFSQGENAISASGEKIPARVEGTFILEDTARGKAMKSGPGAGYLHFPAKNIINPKEGTIEMWVSPVDWEGEQKFHVFFDARGQGSLYLYKYFTGNVLLMLSAPTVNGPYYSANYHYKDWKPGEWRFIVGTWSPTHLSIYVDGNLGATVERPELPESITGEFMVGDNPWNEPSLSRTSQSLITGVRIYDRMLKPEHIAAHYKGDYSAIVPLAADTPILKQTHDINKRQLISTLNMLGIDTGNSPVKAEFSLQQNGRVLEKNKPQDAEGITSSTFSTKDLAAGTYQIVADVTAGEQHALVSRDFIVPDASWIGNTIGKEDKVLPPWTPLRTKTTKNSIIVTCWGREYHFNNAAFPTQITAQNQPLLSKPVELKVHLGQAKLNWRGETIRLKSATPTHALLTGAAEADSPQGKLRLTTEIRIEYDGLVWLSAELQTPQGFKADSISLEIPMRDKNAIYRQNWSGNENNADYKSGSLPAGMGVLQENAFLPYSWIGDNDRGLVWFCETARHWPNFKSKNAFQIERGHDSVTTHLNLLQEQEVPQKWKFEFGLQATPVKPLPEDWRKWRVKPSNGVDGVGTTAAVPWPSLNPDTTLYFGYPEALNPDAYEKMIVRHHAEGKAVIPYLLLNGTPSVSPEWIWFEEAWDSHRGETLPYNWGYLHYIAPTAEHWQDFVIWKTKQFVDKYEIDGAYHDLTYVFGWNTPAVQTGWFDGKEWQKTYPFLAYRELYRRNYAMFKGKNPKSFLWAHNSPVELIPVLAYEDAYLSGETLRNPMLGKENYTEVLSLDQWRTEYTGRQWGVIPFFLPEFDAAKSKEEKPSRGLAALVMLHDTLVWAGPGQGNVSVFNKMYEALDKFGYQDSTFIPYWSEHPPASTEMKDVYISAYKRNDGRALIVVGNTASVPRKGNVVLNLKSLGLPVTKVLSWPDGTPLPMKDDTVALDMDGLDYRLLLVGTPPA
jgi:hypothetical protein